MAKLRPRPRPLPRFASFFLLTLLSLLSTPLSRPSTAAAHFEGFDSDDLDDIDDESIPVPIPSSPPLPTTLTSIPPSPPPPPPPDPTPTPPPPFEFYDDDEFEGIPSQTLTLDPTPDLTPSTPTETTPPPNPPSTPPLYSYFIEIAASIFLVAYIVTYFTGRAENERIALAWAAQFATKNSILDKNFTLLLAGTDHNDAPLLLKEARDVFKFFAGGRRHCRGLFATIELRARHDLIGRASDFVFGRRDLITFEVMMNEEAMDHVVFALMRRKDAKAVHRDAADLKRFGNVVASPPPAGRKWVDEELVVISESKEVAGDLITDAVIDQVFGDKVFEKFGKWFISLHFSDQSPGSHKKVLVFRFALPDAKNMANMAQLVTLVPYYIDLIGRYKLSSQARSKAEAARAKAAQEAYKESQNARQEVLQKRKVERKKLIDEAEAMLSAEVIRKKEDKERARQLKKSAPRVKMLR